MSYTFRIFHHLTSPGVQMIECWRDEKFVAGIYPHQDGLRIVSKFMTEVSKDPTVVGVPSAVIKLK
ncbi:hypothetical protein ES707_03641 [subsurface metagenome]